MKLFAYTVAYDIGFAPNPFYGYCTLTTCKSGIRKAAQVGDWIAGIGSKQKDQSGKLVYAMRVTEKMCYNQYWNASRFQVKKPHSAGSLKQRYGDNIYHQCPESGEWQQEDSRHSLEDGTPNHDHVKRDTKHPLVLISSDFTYFGDQAIDIPDDLRFCKDEDLFQPLRSYRCKFPVDIKCRLIAWIHDLTSGSRIHGDPLDWSGHPIGAALQQGELFSSQ